MTPIQQLYLGVGAKKTTYVDDVFSTYVYTGNNTSRTLNVGIDFTTNGGATLIKNRADSGGDSRWCLFDTVRGNGYLLHPNDTDAQSQSTARQNNFSTTGFDVGSNENETNGNNDGIASWNFKKTKGFFDIIEYTGTGSNQTISHNLGCKPGMIWCKRKDAGSDWVVYHRSLGATQSLRLDSTSARDTNTNRWNDTEPTSTSFTIGTFSEHNTNGGNYIAYLFAGGESTAATARSVEFDGSDDYIRTSDHSDLDLDTNQFTIEMWVRSGDNQTSGNETLVGQWGGNDKGYKVSWSLATTGFDGWGFQYCTNEAGSDVNTINGARIDDDQWHHIAVVRDSSTIKLYTDGNLSSSTSISGSLHISNSDRDFYVGSDDSDNRYTGDVSNVRVIVGTALYTSSFRPSTKPLTNVTNTKLLCCNNSSVTGSTVSPGTIYSGGSPTASTDSPFDDPAGFVFGGSGDQSVVTCNRYIGNGLDDGPEIHLGWEPAFLMVKAANTSGGWYVMDSMRGLGSQSGRQSQNLQLQTNGSEAGGSLFSITATGFKLLHNDSFYNDTNGIYTYLAIRRSDGYVGKPAELGTDVFAMDTGNPTNTIPCFDSGFAVDMGLIKQFGASQDWYLGARSMGPHWLDTNTTDVEGDWANMVFDSNAGYFKHGSYSTGRQAWMWKRHAGFDCVTFKGDGVNGRDIAHSLNAVPEMMIVKGRGSDIANWYVYHKAMGNGRAINLETTDSQSTVSANRWKNTTPTSTHFSIGINPNTSNNYYLALLFSSVEGISKVGSYTGNGSTTGPTITTGFSPRFIILKGMTTTGSWFVYDTLRGLGSGNDQRLQLNSPGNQVAADDVDPSSTGFQLKSDWDQLNSNGNTYMYYAHA